MTIWIGCGVMVMVMNVMTDPRQLVEAAQVLLCRAAVMAGDRGWNEAKSALGDLVMQSMRVESELYRAALESVNNELILLSGLVD